MSSFALGLGLVFGFVAGFTFCAAWVHRVLSAGQRVELQPRRAPPESYAELPPHGKLARLEQVDCLLGWALGDEPYPHGKMYRKENGR